LFRLFLTAGGTLPGKSVSYTHPGGKLKGFGLSGFLPLMGTEGLKSGHNSLGSGKGAGSL